ncbi:MAG: hypothetical protein HFG38_10045 [Eubacterium sp.]|nr:hypothetical protein [Eubacterium sp.]
MEKKKEVPIWEKACMTIEEAAAYSSIGMNKIDELAKILNWQENMDLWAVIW